MQRLYSRRASSSRAFTPNAKECEVGEEMVSRATKVRPRSRQSAEQRLTSPRAACRRGDSRARVSSSEESARL